MVQFDDSLTNSRMKDLRSAEEERMVQSLAPQYGYEYVNLRGYTINPEALTLISEKKARAAEVTGFEVNQKTCLLRLKIPTTQRRKH